jgi:hypothetical protein
MDETMTNVVIDGQTQVADLLPAETVSNEDIYDAVADLSDTADEMSTLAKFIAGSSILGGLAGLFGLGYGIKKGVDWIKNRNDDEEDEEDEKPRRKKSKKRKAKKPVVKGKKARDLDEEDDDEDESEEDSEE